MEVAIDAIESLLENKGVVSFRAPTGTGKTTLLPLGLFLKGFKKILHVQPKSIAVRSSYEYVEFLSYELMNYEVAPKTGTNVRANDDDLRDQFNTKNNINYVTANFALDFIISNEGDNYFSFFDLIIFDEATDPSPEYTTLLLLTRDEITKGNLSSYILLTSASQMEGYVEIDALDPYYYSIPDVPHKIDTFYRPNHKTIHEGVSDILEEASQIVNLSSQSVLIFLPSMRVIEDVKDNLLESYSDLGVEVVEVSSKNPDIENLLSSPPGYGSFRVILSTNIMEQSITVKDLVVVIDSMLEVRPVYGSEKTRTNKKIQKYITKDAANQRKGRTGRERSGICFRMIDERKFQKLADFRVSDLHTSYSDKIFANLVERGYNPFSLMITMDNRKVEESLDWLIASGIVEYTEKNNMIEISDSYLLYSKMPFPIYSLSLLKRHKLDYYWLLVLSVIASFTDKVAPELLQKYCLETIQYRITKTVSQRINEDIVKRIITQLKSVINYLERNNVYFETGDENEIPLLVSLAR